jgi:hypothetical protein
MNGFPVGAALAAGLASAAEAAPCGFQFATFVQPAFFLPLEGLVFEELSDLPFIKLSPLSPELLNR